ncbi:hypothetical protein I4U23_000204 [Adineta vaga]|nr:hypothetical protein I4U23_000204 [Adineta vaga]
MSKTVINIERNEPITYKFRFNNSDKVIQLTEQELARIPFLSIFVLHKDDFSSIQNDQNEYILHYPIHYNWFMAIFRSLSTEQPYALFNELSKDDNILDVLQLLDYLGVQSFPLPLLNEPNIFSLNSINQRNKEKRIRYQRANNLAEVRKTAAGFVLALTRNEYDLNDFKTIKCIFSLISVIFTHKNVFSLRFRYHTYTILEEYVFPLFFNQQSIQHLTLMEHSETVDSEIYLYDDTQPLPTNFENAFVWNGDYRLINGSRSGKSSIMKYLSDNWENRSTDASSSSTVTETVSSLSCAIDDFLRRIELYAYFETTSTLTDPVPKKVFVNEAQLARRAYFDKLPKRSKVDKFKNRYGAKGQNHR